ncbi:MAG: hypothetical protein ABR518_05770, partial [Actinomycetota bacterium]
PNWRADLQRFLGQDLLVEDHLRPFLGVIESARDEFERHIVVWCIDNYVPLRWLPEKDVHVCFYEDFVLRPEEEIARLFAFLNRPYDPHALRVVGKPSATTRRDSAVLSGDGLMDGWRGSVSASQIDGAVRILDGFGLTRVYGADPLPETRQPLAG